MEFKLYILLRWKKKFLIKAMKSKLLRSKIKTFSRCFPSLVSIFSIKSPFMSFMEKCENFFINYLLHAQTLQLSHHAAVTTSVVVDLRKPVVGVSRLAIDECGCQMML
jgi:hypothetical protein